MGYFYKKWYKLNSDKIKSKYKSFYNFEKELGLPKNYSYILKKRKISEDNKYFELLKPYLTLVSDKNNVLENKLNIDNSNKLKDVEEKITKKNIIDLWTTQKMNEHDIASFELLKFIHFETFKDLYDFAGNIRNVNIAKDNFQFVPVRYMDIAIKTFEEMPFETYEEIIDKYAELNVIHPFREGNGRSMRLWLNNTLARKLGKVIDWEVIDKENYLNAMIKSHTDTIPLQNLLKNALTNDFNSKDIFFKGLDKSYQYEEMDSYRSEELK